MGAAAAAVAIAAGAFFSGRQRLEGRWRQQLDETQQSMVLTTPFCLRQFLQSFFLMPFVCLCFISCLCFPFLWCLSLFCLSLLVLSCIQNTFCTCSFFLVYILHLLDLLRFLLVFLIVPVLFVFLLCYLYQLLYAV